MNKVEKVSAKWGRQMKNNNKKLPWFLVQHLKSLEVVTFILTTRKTLNKMKITNFSKIAENRRERQWIQRITTCGTQKGPIWIGTLHTVIEKYLEA